MIDEFGTAVPQMVDDSPVRVVVATQDARGNTLATPTAVTVPVGAVLEIGREGDLPLGDLPISDDEPEDLAVSRVAIQLRCLPAGAMELSVSNLNGVAVHPWGGRTRYLAAGPERQVLSGRVGVRVIGSKSLDDPAVRVYWVFVEGRPAPMRIPLQRSAVTVQNPRPGDLTAAQLEAVWLLFRDHLSWPPKTTPEPQSIEAVASRLGISTAAVNQRLEGARKKAYAFGVAQQYGVTDPEYVYALVAQGFLGHPADPLPAEDLEFFEV